MRIYKAKDYEEMSRKAAGIVSAQIIMKPDCVLGLATGSTPVGLYKQLIEWYRNGDLDFSGVRTVNLDEYKGISRENDQSYYYFMHQNLFDHVNIPAENTHLPDGMEPITSAIFGIKLKITANTAAIRITRGSCTWLNSRTPVFSP